MGERNYDDELFDNINGDTDGDLGNNDDFGGGLLDEGGLIGGEDLFGHEEEFEAPNVTEEPIHATNHEEGGFLDLVGVGEEEVEQEEQENKKKKERKVKKERKEIQKVGEVKEKPYEVLPIESERFELCPMLIDYLLGYLMSVGRDITVDLSAKSLNYLQNKFAVVKKDWFPDTYYNLVLKYAKTLTEKGKNPQITVSEISRTYDKRILKFAYHLYRVWLTEDFRSAIATLIDFMARPFNWYVFYSCDGKLLKEYEKVKLSRGVLCFSKYGELFTPIGERWNLYILLRRVKDVLYLSPYYGDIFVVYSHTKYVKIPIVKSLCVLDSGEVMVKRYLTVTVPITYALVNSKVFGAGIENMVMVSDRSFCGCMII